MPYYPQFAGQSLSDRFKAGKDLMGMAGSALDNLGTAMGLSQDDKKEMEFLLSGAPFAGDLLSLRDNYQWMADYLKNYGMTWGNMKYPGRQNYGGAAWSGVNYVSKNIGKLYDQDDSWTPARHPDPYIPSNVGIRKINGKGRFYRWDY